MLHSSAQFRARVSDTLSWLIALSGVGTILLTGWLVVTSYSSSPRWDGWSEIEFAANEGSQFTLDWLWRQENQHRLVLPKLLLLADLKWFHATQVFLLFSIFTLQFLHLLLLCWSMRVFGNWRGNLWRSGAGLAAFCLFCPSQWENFTIGFQTCFVLPGLFATLSFVGFLLYWTSRNQEDVHGRWKYLVLSIVAALASSYSLSNGNLLWALLVITAFVLRLPTKVTLIYVIAGLTSTALYLKDYTVYGTAISATKSPIMVLKYMAVYFGSSWVPAGVRRAEIVGLLALALPGILVLLVPSHVRGIRPLGIQAILIVMFCLGTAVITALGRLVYGLEQAFSSRYQTVALLFWCCIGLALLAYLPVDEGLRGSGLLLLQALVLAMLIRAGFLAGLPVQSARLFSFQVNAAAAALITDVPDTEQLHWTDSDPFRVRSFVPYMRKTGLAFFHGPLPSLVGKRLDSAVPISSTHECTGEIQSIISVSNVLPPALQVAGWAWDYERRRPAVGVLTVADGLIKGVGVVGGWRPLVRAAHPEITTNYTGFIAYAPDVPASSSVRAYALLGSNFKVACYIGTVRVPKQTDLSRREGP